MIQHICGTKVPATVGDFVEHIAVCPAGQPELAAWARDVVSAVAVAAAMDETVRASSGVSAPVSRDTAETRGAERGMTTRRMAELRDSGKKLREIGDLADVAPEAVRRRLIRLAEGSES